MYIPGECLASLLLYNQVALGCTVRFNCFGLILRFKSSLPKDLADLFHLTNIAGQF